MENSYMQVQRDKRSFEKISGLMQILTDLGVFILDERDKPLAEADAQRFMEYIETITLFVEDEAAMRQGEMKVLFGDSTKKS